MADLPWRGDKVTPESLGDPADPLVQRLVGRTGDAWGAIDFDMAYITEIEEDLWVGGAGWEEICNLDLPDFIEHVASLHSTTFNAYGLTSYLKVEMEDAHDVEINSGLVLATARWVNSCREQGPTLVHCQMGLNRSALVTATALVLGGDTPEEAIAAVRRRSPAVLSNSTFVAWLRAVEAV